MSYPAWLVSSLAACCGYALWAVFQGLAVGQHGKLLPLESRTIIASIPLVLCLATVFTSPANSFRVADLPLRGATFALLAGLSTFIAGKFYAAAVAPPQNGANSVVAAISGAYPAMAFVISAALGLEKVNAMKVLGAVLAVASVVAFSMSPEEVVAAAVAAVEKKKE